MKVGTKMAIPQKYDSKDFLPEEFRATLEDVPEVFIDDVDDDTWASLGYDPQRDTFSIYVDGRQLGEAYAKSIVTINVSREQLFAALELAMEAAQ